MSINPGDGDNSSGVAGWNGWPSRGPPDGPYLPCSESVCPGTNSAS